MAEATTPRDPAPLSLQALADKYAFDAHLAEHRDYYETHWPRYQATLDLLRRAGVRPGRILELGTSAPYVFTALVRETLGDAKFTVVEEAPEGLRWGARVVAKTGPSFEVEALGLNVETTPLPFPDASFDLVVAMEILEHFAIDPGFVFREASRVLREDGVFVVTTPNLVSLGGVWRALRGETPYSFGLFVPWNGVYGRHNREYTPLEVDRLGIYAGFERAVLETIDVYPQDPPPQTLVQYMADHQLPLDLRGQNIFYAGRKRAGAPLGPPPAILFPVDPAIFSGRIDLVRALGDPARVTVRVTNLSPLTWPARGGARVRLSLDAVDEDGKVTWDARTIPLPHDVAPAASADIPLRVENSRSGRRWEIGLYVDGAGPFRGAGRTQPAVLIADTFAAPEDGEMG